MNRHDPCPYGSGMTIGRCHLTDICDCFDYPDVRAEIQKTISYETEESSDE